MNRISIGTLAVGVLALTLLPVGAQAEQAVSFGKYIAYYNAVQTSFLTPKIAQDYGIVRSRNRVMLNISVQQRTGNGLKAVHASVTATASNLSGQLKEIDMREVTDGDAIYYLGEFSVDNEEMLDFTVHIKPEPSGPSHVLRFREQFFTR